MRKEDINALVARSGCSKLEVANALGITDPHFSRLLGRDPDEKTKKRILRGLRGALMRKLQTVLLALDELDQEGEE